MVNHDYYEINEINKGAFRYVLSTGPIDHFGLTLSKEQLMQNLRLETYDINACSHYLNGYSNVDSLENYIINYVSSIEEKPHTIRYMSIPEPGSCACELVVIAKISNNGTYFIFSNNKRYLEAIK